MEVYKLVTGRVVNLAHLIGEVRAVGLSGSHARGGADVLSDVDICVYVEGELPPHDVRRQAYADLGFTEFIYFDVDFEYSRGDGLKVEGVRCDFNWMSIAVVQSFLRGLDQDFDCPEFIPGGLSTVKALVDPDQVIDQLKAVIPQYSEARARHRVAKAMRDAHFSLYGLGWLNKAAFREDDFLFLKYKYRLLELLFRGLYALNHMWLSDEKGLMRRVANFQYGPAQITTRLHSVIMNRDENGTLHGCLASLKELFADTVLCVQQWWPDMDLPSNWQ